MAKNEDKFSQSNWEKRFGHLTRQTDWDKKGRKCKNPDCNHQRLAVDYSTNPPKLLCPLCFTNYFGKE